MECQYTKETVKVKKIEKYKVHITAILEIRWETSGQIPRDKYTLVEVATEW